MAKKKSQPLEDLNSLKDMAESCAFMLGDEGEDVIDGEMDSCPTPIEAELQLMVGKHPNITSVADAALLVIELGNKVILNIVQDHKNGSTTPLTDEELILEQVLAAGDQFHVLPLFPECRLSYKVCCACYMELKFTQDNLKWPLNDELIKIALVAGLADADWVSPDRRALFRRELRRWHDWAVLRLQSVIREDAEGHSKPALLQLIEKAYA